MDAELDRLTPEEYDRMLLAIAYVVSTHALKQLGCYLPFLQHQRDLATRDDPTVMANAILHKFGVDGGANPFDTKPLTAP
jgi:hypothetical protein